MTAERFAQLQTRFKAAYREIFDDTQAARTVVIVPSLTVNVDVMAKITGVHRYEERMLCLLLLLRMPQTRVIYITSSPICETIIDYYLHLLPGIPSGHARRRLTVLSCEDLAPVALSRKILERPLLLERIKSAIGDTRNAHMTCFTVTDLERDLALALNLPIYGCDPSLQYWGTKSGSRRIFREAGIAMAPGYEDLATSDDVARAIAELKHEHLGLEKAVVKINEGFSGEGNAVITLKDAPMGTGLLDWVRARLENMTFEACGMTWELYQSKLTAMGGIVEAFISGGIKQSPSVQFRVDPLDRLEAISTHDQVLGGANQQIFLGCRFPANADYRLDLQAGATAAARVLASKGVLGRFGFDFISVKEGNAWKHYAIEINLRKGGTTHPFLMLKFLTDGNYDAQTGEFLTPSGRPRCYFASDNLESERYHGLCSEDLIDIAVRNGLHFHAATGEGVAFHLIGALSEFGKLGVVAIGETPERAEALYRKTVSVLDAEGTART